MKRNVLLVLVLLLICALTPAMAEEAVYDYTVQTYVGADEWLGAYAFDGDENQSLRSLDAKVTWEGVTDSFGFQELEGELADPVAMLHVTQLPCEAACTIQKGGEQLTMRYHFEQGVIEEIEIAGDRECTLSEFGGYDVAIAAGEPFTLTCNVTLTQQAIDAGCTVRQEWSLWDSGTEQETTTNTDTLSAMATDTMGYSVCDAWIEVLDRDGNTLAFASVMCTLVLEGE